MTTEPSDESVEQITNVTLAKALFATARARHLASPDTEAGSEPARFGPLESADQIEILWDVPPGDPWEVQQQSWIAEAKTLRAALAALAPARDGWRPIESAPRDGTRVQGLVECELEWREAEPAGLISGGWHFASDKHKVVGWRPAAPSPSGAEGV